MSTVSLLSGPSTQLINDTIKKNGSHCQRESFRAAEKLLEEIGGDPFKFFTDTEFDEVFEAMQKKYFEWTPEDCQYLHTQLIQIINSFSAEIHQTRTGRKLALPKQRSTATFIEVYEVYAMTTFEWFPEEKEDLCLFLVQNIYEIRPNSEEKTIEKQLQKKLNCGGNCCDKENVSARPLKLSLNDFSSSTKKFTSISEKSSEQPLWNSMVLMPSVLW